MQIALAEEADIPGYVAFAQMAQRSLISKGLAQWVPAAHSPYRAAIVGQILDRSLYVVRRQKVPVAFFALTDAPSQWWEDHKTPALYLSGIVVSGDAAGLNIGHAIVDWAVAQARVRSASVVRLDCHAGNSWLRAYYENLGFAERGRVEQHPGYGGCLYERKIGALMEKHKT